MELSTIIGIVIAVAAILIAMIFKGVAFKALANPAAFLVIIAGTIGAIFVAFPSNDLKRVPKLFGVIFKKSQGLTTEEAIDKLVEFSELIRREGLLALESKASEIDDPFMKRGVLMLMDGCDSQFISDALMEEIAAMEDRHQANAGVFTQAGTYAPTLGVLGAVLGLIAALGNMNDTEALGHAISAAFIATLLGIFTGYVLWHPMANKLKRKSKQEAVIKTIIMEGILSLNEGLNPRLLKERLLSYVPAGQRPDDESKEN